MAEHRALGKHARVDKVEEAIMCKQESGANGSSTSRSLVRKRMSRSSPSIIP